MVAIRYANGSLEQQNAVLFENVTTDIKGLDKSVDLDLLREAIVSNNMDKVESMFEEIGRNKLQEAIPLLIEYLKSTESNILRNSIANYVK